MTRAQEIWSEQHRRWDGQALWEASENLRRIANQAMDKYPDDWHAASGDDGPIADDVAQALAGVILVAARLGFHPAPTAPDSASQR